jgi:diacylglycerol kinase family enzyme
MRAFVVLNPAAGQEGHEPVREALADHLGPSRTEFEVHETRREDDLGEIVRARRRSGFDLVVAAGGDGTVSDVIDGLVGTSIPLGIVPTGTGNLVARDLGIPNEIDDAVRLIAGAPRSRKIDAMRIGDRVFVLNVSVGFSAAVIRGTSQGNKHRFGRIAYLGAIVSKIFTSRPRTLVVTADGARHEYRALEVAIMNCGMLAKMLYPKGPEIRIDDGRLDVFVLGIRTIREYPRFVVGMSRGTSERKDASPSGAMFPCRCRPTETSSGQPRSRSSFCPERSRCSFPRKTRTSRRQTRAGRRPGTRRASRPPV